MPPSHDQWGEIGGGGSNGFLTDIFDGTTTPAMDGSRVAFTMSQAVSDEKFVMVLMALVTMITLIWSRMHYTSDILVAIIVYRIVDVDSNCCIRIVDIIGNIPLDFFPRLSAINC